MEQENIIKEDKNRLHTVTPFSRCLAMVLFIAFPFIGGWIGYSLAPLNSVSETIWPVPPTELTNVASTTSIVPNAETSTSSQPFSESDWESSLSKELRFTLLYATPDKKAYYESGIPGSSACCEIFRLDYPTNSFNFVTRVDIINDKLSPSKKFFTKVGVVDEKEIIEIFSIETGLLVKSLDVAEQGQTIVSSECGYGGYAYDLNWTSDNVLKYGIFNSDSVDRCNKDLLEHRYIEI